MDFMSVINLVVPLFQLLCWIFRFLSRKKTLNEDKMDILRWATDSAGVDIKSLQQLWDIGPSSLGKYVEQLNTPGVTWWSLQDLARSTYAVPQVMSRRDMTSRFLRENAEKKFLRFLKRLKEALERSTGPNSETRLRVSGDLVAKGVALAAAYTDLRGVFFVYSYRNQLEGIQITMDGPCEVQVETKLKNDGLMVSYIAPQKGIYSLEISKNNWFAPGSPFQVNVQDPPIGYTGSFGGSLWNQPDVNDRNRPSATIEMPKPPEKIIWDVPNDVIPEHKSQPQTISQPLPSRPIRKKKTIQAPQVVELSQVAAAIILARRFTNRMQSRIPELRIERSNDYQTEFNLQTTITSPPSPREITYVSPDGATFPISVLASKGENGQGKWNYQQGDCCNTWFMGSAIDATQAPVCEDYDHSQWREKRLEQPSSLARTLNRDGNYHSLESSYKKNRRMWTCCKSIGVNTDEVLLNFEKKITASIGVQVEESITSSSSREEMPHLSYQTGSFKGQSSNDSFKVRKIDTCSEDSSSGNTNFSEKIIEMDLKVQYETIAVTTDDERSYTDESGLLCTELYKRHEDGKDGSQQSTREEIVDKDEGVYKAEIYSVDNSLSEDDLRETCGFTIQVTKTEDSMDFTVQNYENSLSDLASCKTAVETIEDSVALERKTLNHQSYQHFIRLLKQKSKSGYSPDRSFKKKKIETINIQSRKKFTSPPPPKTHLKRSSGSSRRRLKNSLLFVTKLRQYSQINLVRTESFFTFGTYPVEKDIFKITTPVLAWKDFWDNYASRKSPCSPRKTQENVEVQEAAKATEEAELRKEVSPECPAAEEKQQISERKRRFEDARKLFSKLEKDTTSSGGSLDRKTSSENNSLSLKHTLSREWDLKNLFNDFHQGIGIPGVANRLGVLSTLQSVEPVLNAGGFATEYPHLPDNKPSALEWIRPKE